MEKTKLKPFGVSVCMIAYANYFTDARIKNYVQALLKQGYEVDVFALGREESCPPGLHFVCLGKKVESQQALPYLVSQIRFLFFALFHVGRSFFRRRYQIIHVHNMPDFIVFSALLPKLFGAKIILDIHDTMPEAYATKMDISLSHPIIRLIRLEERLSAAFVDYVITTNDLHREALIEHGIRPEKIGVILNTGNEAIFYPRPRSQTSDGLTLAYHGTIAARLGLDIVLDAIRLALPSCPNLRFLLIGDGEFLPTVKRLIEEFELTNVVECKGWAPVEDLPSHLSTVDVGIIGNRGLLEVRKNWMLPVKMLEYAAMEIPTIAPRLRVIRHYFDEDSAFYYSPDDVDDLAKQIIDVYKKPEKIVDVKKQLQAFNQKYCWSAMEKMYLGMIANLISH